MSSDDQSAFTARPGFGAGYSYRHQASTTEFPGPGIVQVIPYNPMREYFFALQTFAGMESLTISPFPTALQNQGGHFFDPIIPFERWNERHGTLCQAAWYVDIFGGPAFIYLEELIRVYSGSGNRTEQRDEHVPVHSGSRFDQRGWHRLKQDVNLTVTASRLSRGTSHIDIFSGK